MAENISANSVFRRLRARRIVIGTLAVALVTVVVTLGMLFGPMLRTYWSYEPREGDIIFQSLPRMPLVNAIEGGSESPWSHCGIVARDADGNWIVYEALGRVRATPMWKFVARSRGGRFAVYRLKEEFAPQIPAVIEKTCGYLGRPYDIHYDLDDAKIYCSELIYKAYRDATGTPLGKLVKLGDLKWQPYQQIIEDIEQGPVPVDREMITPRDLAAAPELELVTECGKK